MSLITSISEKKLIQQLLMLKKQLKEISGQNAIYLKKIKHLEFLVKKLKKQKNKLLKKKYEHVAIYNKRDIKTKFFYENDGQLLINKIFGSTDDEQDN